MHAKESLFPWEVVAKNLGLGNELGDCQETVANAASLLLRGDYPEMIVCLEKKLGTAGLSGLQFEDLQAHQSLASRLGAASCIYLYGLALFRKAEYARARAAWKALERFESLEFFSAFEKLVQFHKSVYFVSHGQYLSALANLSTHKIEGFADLHSQSMFAGLKFSCALTLGNFAVANAMLEEEVCVSRRARNPFWLASCRRLEINMLIEKEEISGASQKLEEWLVGESISPVTEVLLLKLQFRCLVLIGNPALIIDGFARLSARMFALGISAEAVSIVEERCEVLLAQIYAFKDSGGSSQSSPHNPLQELYAPLGELRQILARVVSTGDVAAECVTRVSLGRLHLVGDSVEEAEVQIGAAHAIAKMQKYVSLIATISLQRAKIALRKRDFNAALQALDEGAEHATHLNLKLTSEKIRNLQQVLQRDPFKVLLILLENQRLRDPWFWREFGGMLPFGGVSFSLQMNGRKKQVLGVHLISQLFAVGDAFLFLRPAGVLFRLSDTGVSLVLNAHKGTLVGRVLFELFCSESLQLADEEIAQVQLQGQIFEENPKSKKPMFEFHPLRHGAAVRTAVSRVRKTLTPLNLSLLRNASGDGYFLSSEIPVVGLEILHRARGGGSDSSKRGEGSEAEKPTAAEQVFAYLAEVGEVELAKLLEHFGFSRQALHRHTTQLLKEGRIKRARIGRGFLYGTK